MTSRHARRHRPSASPKGRSTPARELYCMIHGGGKEYCIDPAGDLLKVLGRAWTLPLVGALGNAPTFRFNELQGSIGGIGTRVLTQRLKELHRLGLISRTVHAEVPARVEYRLTRTGKGVHQALVPLLAIASRFPRGAASGPARARSRRTLGTPPP